MKMSGKIPRDVIPPVLDHVSFLRIGNEDVVPKCRLAQLRLRVAHWYNPFRMKIVRLQEKVTAKLEAEAPPLNGAL